MYFLPLHEHSLFLKFNAKREYIDREHECGFSSGLVPYASMTPLGITGFFATLTHCTVGYRSLRKLPGKLEPCDF